MGDERLASYLAKMGYSGVGGNLGSGTDPLYRKPNPAIASRGEPNVRRMHGTETGVGNFFTVNFHWDDVDDNYDDGMNWVAPLDVILVSASMTLENTGTTGGATTLSVADTAGDLITSGSGLLSVAQGAANAYASCDIYNDSADVTYRRGYAGEVYTVNIDAHPTDDNGKDLCVTLGFLTI